MTLDEAILGEAKAARETVLEIERQQEHARVDFHHQIRRLHAVGGSLREIADALGLSHQRVHQIVGEQEPGPHWGHPGPERVGEIRREIRKLRRGGRGRGFVTRFTDEGREIVVRAQEECREFGHGAVGTEHILLAFLRSDDTGAGRALRSLGADYDRARAELVRTHGEGGETPAGHIPFTRASKRTLELALREALRLGHKHIGSEHVLLGMLDDRRAGGGEILERLGVDRDAARRAAEEQLAA